MKKVLVVAAHADDEILGCGGTMAKHVDAGDDVAVVFMTDGVGARPDDSASEDVELRESAANKALSIIGARLLAQLNLPDNSMDMMARIEITQQLEPIIDSFNPNIIYTHHGGDLNVDHRRVLEAVLTACRPQPHCNVDEIYSFEVASSTAWHGSSLARDFTPHCYIDISEQLNRKLQALEAYREEMRGFPHARSLKALEHQAHWRGSQIGVSAAEGFVVERKIVR